METVLAFAGLIIAMIIMLIFVNMDGYWRRK